MEKTKHLPPEELLKHYWTRELPVNTGTIALHSKVRLMITPKVSVHHIDIDEENDSYIIYISNSLDRNLAFYTFAHCLGHIHCGHLEDPCYLINDPRHIERFEDEANHYARQLVVPLNVLKARKENDNLNTEQLSKVFGVSEEIIKKQLSLLEKQ